MLPSVDIAEGDHEGPDPPSAVVYIRVSTQEQGRDGLGMSAQRSVVERFCARSGLQIVREYAEVQTGRRDHLRNRPELRAAVAHARRLGAPLVVARVDRLSRSVLVTAQILASGVTLVAVGAPDATHMTLQLGALVAEYESRLISQRTKEGMHAAQARGVSFTRTSWHFPSETRLKAARNAANAHRARARECYADLAPIAVALRGEGETWAAVARYLNGEGHRSSAGGPWAIAAVQRLVRRELDAVNAQRELVIGSFRSVAGSAARKAADVPIASRPQPITLDVPPDSASVGSGRAIAYCRVSTKTSRHRQ